MNNQSVSLVATTNIKQDRQKIWQPTVGEVLVVLKAANKQESPPPPPLVQTKKIVCIEQIVGRPYGLDFTIGPTCGGNSDQPRRLTRSDCCACACTDMS